MREVGLREGIFRRRVLGVLHGDCTTFEQGLRAICFTLRELEPRASTLERGLRARDLDAIDARVDLIEALPLLHRLALDEQTTAQNAAHLRAQFSGAQGDHATGQDILHGGRFGMHGDDADLDRASRRTLFGGFVCTSHRQREHGDHRDQRAVDLIRELQKDLIVAVDQNRRPAHHRSAIGVIDAVLPIATASRKCEIASRGGLWPWS